MKREKKGQNQTGEKRPRKSIELEAETAPQAELQPAPASASLSMPPWMKEMPFTESDLHSMISQRCPGLGLSFIPSLFSLIQNGAIIDRENLLRGGSGNQSWDTGDRLEIDFDLLGCSGFSYVDPGDKENLKKRVEQFIDSVRDSQYFDIDPMTRPKEMFEGPYLLCPGDLKDQKDPIFEKKPILMQYQSNVEKLAKAAVEFHNYLTDANVRFFKVNKANLFFELGCQLYFITFEVYDTQGEKVTCKSRVDCEIDEDDFPIIHGQSCIEETCVRSFIFEN